ncbi:MAG TPA: AAA family ATPase, partial [Candidatus Limnocylindrales bacterium]|nr:AAA family ATPase [Candidatus Limnocylindrales bacterium]
MSTAFVGRQPELDRLEGLLQRARAGAAVAALIRGDPGSGKSRLLHEVVERHPIRQRVQLLGFEPTQSIPLASAAELLRWLRRVPIEGPRLESLVFAADAPEARDPVRIFEAAHRALAAAGSALVVVDDTQWLDDLTLALLLYLVRAAAAGSGGLALLAAGRPSPASDDLTRAIEAALPAGHRAVLDLAPLNRSDGIELARGLDGKLDEDAALELWRRAAGSPFWLETLALRRTAGTVAGVIGQRLASLGPDAARLMAALGVAGRPYLLEQLRDVLEWDDTRVAAATRELASGGLLTQGGGTVRIAHDLIREEAAAGIRPSLRRRLHARIAETIEADAGEELGLLREALEHRIAAGMDASGLALRLASSPQRRLLGRDGLQVLAAIADALPAGSEDQITLNERLGEIAASLADQELAEDRWTRVADAGAPTRRRRALVEAGRAAYHRQDGRRARSLAGLARSMLPHADLAEARGLAADPELLEEAARLHALEADVALWLEHETAAGEAAAASGLAIARRMAEVRGGVGALLPSQRATYLRGLESAMDAALQADRGAEVVELGDETLRVAERGGSEARAAALNRVAFAMASIGLVRDAARLYGEAWALANDLVLPSAAVDAGHGLASALHQVGPVPRAREMALATIDLESRLRNAPRRWGHAGAVLHNIELSLGDPVAALRFLREDAAHEADPHFRLGIHQTVAVWEARLSGPAAAARASASLAAAMADWALVRCP